MATDKCLNAYIRVAVLYKNIKLVRISVYFIIKWQIVKCRYALYPYDGSIDAFCWRCIFKYC